MEIELISIIAFLSGSLGTLIIKGIIDFINKRIEYKRGIKKDFFGKKLLAAEEAIRSLFGSYQSTIIIVHAIDNLLERDMDGDLFDELWNTYFEKLASIENQFLNSSVSLFFELENEDLWNNDDQRELFDIYSNIKIIIDEVEYLNKELDLASQERAGLIRKRLDEEIKNELMTELRKLSEKLTKNYNATFSNIQMIKNELRENL